MSNLNKYREYVFKYVLLRLWLYMRILFAYVPCNTFCKTIILQNIYDWFIIIPNYNWANFVHTQTDCLLYTRPYFHNRIRQMRPGHWG